MNAEDLGPLAAALGLGAILQAIVARYLGRPGPTGADGRLADAQADKARAEAESVMTASMAATIRVLVERVAYLEQREAHLVEIVTTQRVKIDDLTARMAMLESKARGGGPSALDDEGGV